MKNEIFKLAKLEAEWLRYYTHKDSRNSEKFVDIYFYDRLISIGYAKVNTELIFRCPMGFVKTLKISDNIKICNKEDNAFTCLQFVIYNKIDGYLDLISIIKS